MISHGKWYLRGLRDGIPIALGYLAVALTLGIAAKNAGLTAFQATLTSFTVTASAGEFVGFSLIAAGAGYLEVLVMEAIANARYLLMSCSLSQKFSSDTKLIHRLLIGWFVTDEVFGVASAIEGKVDPFYIYGIITLAAPGWSLGTFLGAILGNILPVRVMSALSVALFAMFIAIIVPPARKNKLLAGLILLSFAASYALNRVSWFDGISSGIKTILLTLVLSLAAALLFPVRDDPDGGDRSSSEPKGGGAS